MFATRPPSVLRQQGRARVPAPSCWRPLGAAPAAPAAPPARRRTTLVKLSASASAPRDGGSAPLLTSATAVADQEQEAPDSSSSGTKTWEDLYIIPSSFDDDDEGDDEISDGSDADADAVNPAQEGGKKTRVRARVRAWPGAGPIVLLPGFGNDTQDYEAPFGDSRRGLAPRLRRRGFVVETCKLRRRDWLRVARAIASPTFWRGEADVGPGYGWYLLRVAAAVRRAELAWEEQEKVAVAAAEGEAAAAAAGRPPPTARRPRVTLVGHSAGGWLARAFLGDASLRPSSVAEAAQREEDRALAALAEATRQGREGGAGASLREALLTAREVLLSPPPPLSSSLEAGAAVPTPCRREPHPSVGALVTLGTPHTAPGPGARDVTGGALGWVNEHWPGAFFGKRGMRRICEEEDDGAAAGSSSSSRRMVYVTVAGRAVVAPPADVALPRGSPPSYAREAYRAVAGAAGVAVAAVAGAEGRLEGGGGPPVAAAATQGQVGVEGDAVVPLSVASGGLPGADASVVLDGVWHSMSRVGTFKEPPPSSSSSSSSTSSASTTTRRGGVGGGGVGVRPWYGSGGALDAWLAALRDAERAAAAEGEEEGGR